MKLLLKTFFFIFLIIMLAEGCSRKISTVAIDSAEIKSRDLDKTDSDRNNISDIDDNRDEEPLSPIDVTARPLSDIPIVTGAPVIIYPNSNKENRLEKLKPVFENKTKKASEAKEYTTERNPSINPKRGREINSVKQDQPQSGFIAFKTLPKKIKLDSTFNFWVAIDKDTSSLKEVIDQETKDDGTSKLFQWNGQREVFGETTLRLTDIGDSMKVVLDITPASHFTISTPKDQKEIQSLQPRSTPRWQWMLTPDSVGDAMIQFIVYKIEKRNEASAQWFKDEQNIQVLEEKANLVVIKPPLKWYKNPHVWGFSILGIGLLGFVFFKLKRKKENPKEIEKTTPTKTVVPPFVPISNITKKKVFLSYAHEDELWKEKLDNHLSALKLTDMIETWNDRKIPIGEVWDDIIVKELLEADIILILISSDFLASEYIFEKELPKAIERHDNGVAKVIPIYIRDCDFRGLPFERLEGFPKDGIAVASHEEHLQDAALKEVSLGIRTIVEFQE